MIIGILQIHLHIPACRSLKTKRMHIKSICARVKNKFNVSVAEIDLQNRWDESVIGVGHVSNSTQITNKIVSQVLNFVSAYHGVDIIDHKIEVI